jgi:tetratricopeptide (TPR) repeat protein
MLCSPRRIGRAVRAHRWRTILLFGLLLVAAAVGGYAYARAQWRGAQAAVQERRFDDAKRRLDFCLRVWPDSPEVHLLAARHARLTGEYEAAETHLNRCLKLQGGATEATQLEFLLMRAQTGEIDEVDPVLQSYVNRGHAETPLILETMSRAYMHHLRYGPAFGILTRWIELYPDAAQPHHWRGWVLERLNSAKGAMRDYQRALELDPDNAVVRLRVAEMLLEDKLPLEALPHLDLLRSQFPDRPDIQARLGQCRFLQGRAKEARELLEAALPNLPSDPPLLLYLAKLEVQERRPDKAEQYLRRLLQLDPADTDAQYTLVTVLQLLKRREEAVVALQEYEKHRALLERANTLLREEAERPSNDPRPPSEIGILLLQLGQERQGLYWLDQALVRNPDHQESHRALAEHFERKGEHDRAAAHRRKLKGKQ